MEEDHQSEVDMQAQECRLTQRFKDNIQGQLTSALNHPAINVTCGEHLTKSQKTQMKIRKPHTKSRSRPMQTWRYSRPTWRATKSPELVFPRTTKRPGKAREEETTGTSSEAKISSTTHLALTTLTRGSWSWRGRTTHERSNHLQPIARACLRLERSLMRSHL